jgi:eukaryotic-like serine/threonine-protein kinase
MTILTDTASRVAAETQRELLSPGTSVGPWRIEELVGTGGMGDVYAVVHETIGKRAAMKLLHREHARAIDAERVTLEGWVVNQVGHPSIVDIFDHGMLDGRPYLVMERLRGETLAARLARGHVAPADAIAILLQLCDALNAAHDAGIIHRDLKPDNIFLRDDQERGTPQVKLLDWSIAKVIGDTAKRTIEGHIIGTPDYLAPEQACGMSITPATDIYSLGVIAYKMFLGRLPYDADDAVDMVTKHVTATPHRPSELWPLMPMRLERLMLAMLSKHPGERPNCNVVAWSLRLLLSELATPANTSASDPTKSRGDRSSRPPSRLPTIGFALLAVTTGTLFVDARSVHVQTLALDSGEVLPAVAPPPAIAPPPVSPTTMPQPAATFALVAVQQPTARPEAAPRTKPAGSSRTAQRVPRPASRAVREQATASTADSPATPTRLSPSSAELVAHYQEVGRELDLRRSRIDVSDLWPRYRLIRIYEALPTSEGRRDASDSLVAIQQQISLRLASDR